jgi:hypothetical protein
MEYMRLINFIGTHETIMEQEYNGTKIVIYQGPRGLGGGGRGRKGEIKQLGL